MKYFTETISAALAEKLKEKGMPIEMQPLYAQEAPNARGIVKAGVGLWCPSYAEVFDWLMEKGTYIDGYPIYHIPNKHYTNEWCFYVMSNDITQEKEADYESFGDWHEAANAAIEKALELI